MRVLYKIILGITLIALIFAILASQRVEQKEHTYYEQVSSDYGYELWITTSDVLDNLTVYLPLPGPETQYFFGNSIIEQNFSNTDPSWKYSIVETEYGAMLSISKDKIDPQVLLDYENQTKVIRGEHEDIPFTFGMGMPANHRINTSSPIENEPILTPMYNITLIRNDAGSETAKTYRFDSRLYCNYNTENSTTVKISLLNIGCNSWWPKGEDVNEVNYYANRIETNLSGPQDGWIIVNGELATGEGTYLEE